MTKPTPRKDESGSKDVSGSQKWIRALVNDHGAILDARIAAAAPKIRTPIQWVSPLRSEDYREYRDQQFLDQLGIRLKTRTLFEFWPFGGPRWDALGIAADGSKILVEAKARKGEAKSDCRGTSPSSLAKIRRSFAEVQAHLEAAPGRDWTSEYYQYANRLAHQYLLREVNKVPSWLVFLYCLNDDHDTAITTRKDWEREQAQIHRALGIRERGSHVVDVYVDVKELPAPVAASKGVDRG